MKEETIKENIKSMFSIVRMSLEPGSGESNVSYKLEDNFEKVREQNNKLKEEAEEWRSKFIGVTAQLMRSESINDELKKQRTGYDLEGLLEWIDNDMRPDDFPTKANVLLSVKEKIRYLIKQKSQSIPQVEANSDAVKFAEWMEANTIKSRNGRYQLGTIYCVKNKVSEETLEKIFYLTELYDLFKNKP